MLIFLVLSSEWASNLFHVMRPNNTKHIVLKRQSNKTLGCNKAVAQYGKEEYKLSAKQK